MKKTILMFVAVVASIGVICTQNISDSLKLIKLNEIVILPQTAQEQSAVVKSKLDKEQIVSNNVANSFPDILKFTPSALSYNEGGTAVGNSFFTIRGSSPNRINVTLNGMPMSNPESQEMFWVNLPNLSGSLRSVQVQRGVGTSVAGTASFGGNISMQTDVNESKPYVELATAVGQYNTFTQSVAMGTGMLKEKLALDVRYSHVKSDGYIRNGKVNHHNVFANLSYFHQNNFFKVVYIHGIQHTGITWEGVSAEEIQEFGRRYNPAGKYDDKEGISHYYKNETDNYYSHILQGIYSVAFNSEFTFNANIGYNNGYGYYENYKSDQTFDSYDLPAQIIGDKVYLQSDIITRKLMKNDYYYISSFINYVKDKLEITYGANYGFYDGNHYGKLLWVNYKQTIPDNYEWYRNKGKKADFNTFLKVNYSLLPNLRMEAELHGRFLEYKLHGKDDDKAILDKNLYYHFFNPRIGLNYAINSQNRLYASLALANREPQRSDLKESVKENASEPIKPERLLDYELGYQFSSNKLNFGANLYYMKYHNQLVQTGKLSSVGYKFQQNVKDSYRMGLELDISYQYSNCITVGFNVTLSKNKIKNFTNYYDLYQNADNYIKVGQKQKFFDETSISFSPNTIAGVCVNLQPLQSKAFYINFAGKYVGRMYYDNASNKQNRLSDYWVFDANLSYNMKLKGIPDLEFRLIVNNLMNKKYIANAWVETVYFAEGEVKEMTFKGFYPQAERNIMGRIIVKF